MSLNAHNNLLPCTYYTLSAMSPFTPVATSRTHAVSSNVNIVWSYVARYTTLKHSPRLAPVALDRLRGVGVGLPFFGRPLGHPVRYCVVPWSPICWVAVLVAPSCDLALIWFLFPLGLPFRSPFSLRGRLHILSHCHTRCTYSCYVTCRSGCLLGRPCALVAVLVLACNALWVAVRVS